MENFDIRLKTISNIASGKDISIVSLRLGDGYSISTINNYLSGNGKDVEKSEKIINEFKILFVEKYHSILESVNLL